jgi:hypothetical protein
MRKSHSVRSRGVRGGSISLEFNYELATDCLVVYGQAPLNTANQAMNRAFIHPFVGSVMLWFPLPSSRDIGCLNAGVHIR